MKQILCSDWLPELARSCPLQTSHLVPQEKSSLFRHVNNSLIDQACWVEDSWILVSLHETFSHAVHTCIYLILQMYMYNNNIKVVTGIKLQVASQMISQFYFKFVLHQLVNQRENLTQMRSHWRPLFHTQTFNFHSLAY